MFELISIWQNKILLLNNVVANIDSQRSKLDFHYVQIQPWQKSNPKDPNLTHRGSKSASRGSKSSKGPKRTFWVKKLYFQRPEIDSQRPKVNSYGPKYTPEAQNWVAEVQASCRCLKVTPRALKFTLKGLITVPHKLTTKAQIRRPKTRNRLSEARLWLLKAQN